MQELSERNDLTSRGQRIISILLFEDLLIVPLLAFVAFYRRIKLLQLIRFWPQNCNIRHGFCCFSGSRTLALKPII